MEQGITKSSLTLIKRCYQFIILMGFVSLFADVCYEGARSIIGPFMASLGASAAVVGIVAGGGELIGYGVRYLSGAASDRMQSYWPLTIAGYAINIIAVPFLALAGSWQVAAVLIILERVGKALRAAPRDVMLSYASERIGRGKGFGIHKALDQTGALIGPLFIAWILLKGESYRFGFAFLAIPALICLIVLVAARVSFPKPRDLESHMPKIDTHGYSNQFWLYIIALCFFAFGYIDFPLIAFHYVTQNVVADYWIPVFYGIAMGMAGLSALFLGRWYDRWGIPVIISISLLSACMAPLAFAGNFFAALVGMILWGLGMGAQDSVIKAFIGDLVPPDRRGSAYGLLNMLFGISWFLGSALMGIVYEFSLPAMIAISVLSILASIPFLLKLKHRHKTL